MLCLIKLNERTYIVKQYIRIINVIEYFFLFLYAKIYIGVKNAGFDKQEKKNLTISFETLKNGLKSNFPGTTFKDVPSKEVLPRVIDEILLHTVGSDVDKAYFRDFNTSEQLRVLQWWDNFLFELCPE